MSQQNVIDGIKTKLYADTGAGGVHTLVGGRIFEGEGNQNADLPLVVFGLVTDHHFGHFTTDDLEATFQTDVYSDKANGAAVARVISDRLHALLHRQTITVPGHNAAETWCEERGVLTYEEDSCRIRQDWRIFGTPT